MDDELRDYLMSMERQIGSRIDALGKRLDGRMDGLEGELKQQGMLMRAMARVVLKPEVELEDESVEDEAVRALSALGLKYEIILPCVLEVMEDGLSAEEVVRRVLVRSLSDDELRDAIMRQGCGRQARTAARESATWQHYAFEVEEFP